MKTTIVLILVFLVVASSCSRGEDVSPPPEKDTSSRALQDKPATLESCLATAKMFEFIMKEAAAGVHTAEMGSRLSAEARQEGIIIARERLKITGEMLDLFERDSVQFRDDPQIKPYIMALPGYRKRLAEYSTKLNRLSQ